MKNSFQQKFVDRRHQSALGRPRKAVMMRKAHAPYAARDLASSGYRIALSAPLATWFMWLGLFTVSWDRFGNFQVASFNVKLAVLAFAISSFLILIDKVQAGAVPGNPLGHAIIPWSLAVAAVLFVMGLLADDRVAALLQLVTVILGSLLPFFAIYLNVRTFGRVEEALTVLIRGGVVAALFGLYQLAAFYVGAPQFIAYTAVGGGAGRISSFSYESGYFGYFLILTMASIFARAHLRGRAPSYPLLGFLLVTLILVNSRATYLTIPVFLALLLLRWPSGVSRGKLVVALFWVLVIGFFAAIFASERIVRAVEWAATIFDPSEVTSNAPRLQAFQFQLDIIRDNVFTGVGAGNLAGAYADYANLTVSRASNEAVANNIYLQALLDGGVPLLLAETLFVVVAIYTLFFRGTPTSRFLMMGWMTVLFVGGLVTSYFFDIKLWTVLALAAALAAEGDTQDAEPLGPCRTSVVRSS